MQFAIDAVVQSWRLDPNSADKLFERTANSLHYWQRRNGTARRSHTKAAIRKLRRVGIDPDNLKRCGFNTS